MDLPSLRPIRCFRIQTAQNNHNVHEIDLVQFYLCHNFTIFQKVYHSHINKNRKFDIDNFAIRFNCTPVRASDLLMAPCKKISFKLVGAWCSVFGRAHRGSTVGLLLPQRFNVGLAAKYSSCFSSELNIDLYVCCCGALMSRSPSRGPNSF